MKKIVTLLLCMGMVASLAACAGRAAQSIEQNSAADTQTPERPAAEDTQEIAPAAQTPEDAQSQTQPDEADGAGETEEPEGTEETEEMEEMEEASEAQAGRVLVAFFSATGTTKGVAEQLADGLGADLYEIVPEEPYTEADLNYNDNGSRTTAEMNDPNARPAISGAVENMQQYDIVFLGYPIWWGEAPRIVSTFVESYDFTGKTIVPFCTSGGSGIGESAANLEQLTTGGTWLDGRRLSGSDAQDALMEWVNGLGLDFEG